MPLSVSDNITSWKPHKKQEEFIRIPFDVFEALYGGAAGGGKSELALILPIIYGFTDNPRFQGIIFRRTFPELEKSLIPRSHEYYRPLGATYNQQRKEWTFPSGAKQYFGHCEAIKDVYQYQSAEFQLMQFDELTHFSEFQYLYLTSRVRASFNIPKIIRNYSNPGNVGHAWVRKTFIDKAREGGKLIYDAKSKTYRIFIKAKATDNPYLLHNDPGYYDRLHRLPPAEQKALIDGDWYAFAGQVFTEFRQYHHPLEPANALHVIKPFLIPQWWPKIRFLDWGYRANTYAGWLAITPEARIILYREYICQKKTIKTYGADLARLSQYDGNIKASFLDPSAWKEEGHEHNIADQIMAATNSIWERANNDRIAGKLLLHDLLRWEPKDVTFLPKDNYSRELHNQILRFHGTEAADSYEKMFQPEDKETNIPRLQIFDTCPSIIEALQLCVYNDDDAKGKRKEDVAEFEGDDPYDAIRYGVTGVDRYLAEVAEEFKRMSRIDGLLKKRDESGDMTTFYRAMEQLEAELEGDGEVIASERMSRYARLAKTYN